MIIKFREFTDKMCACKDAKCAQEVSDQMTKWGQEQAKEQTEPPKMTEEQTKQATELGEQMGNCMTKAMGAGGDMPPIEGQGNPNMEGSSDSQMQLDELRGKLDQNGRDPSSK